MATSARTRRIRLAVAGGIAVLGMAATSTAAGAHTSSYCGHGSDGNITITKWQNHILYPQWPYHQNNYKHYSYNWATGGATFDHNASTICTGGV